MNHEHTDRYVVIKSAFQSAVGMELRGLVVIGVDDLHRTYYGAIHSESPTEIRAMLDQVKRAERFLESALKRVTEPRTANSTDAESVAPGKTSGGRAAHANPARVNER